MRKLTLQFLIVLAVLCCTHHVIALGPDTRLQEDGVWHEGKFYTYDPAGMVQRHLQQCREDHKRRRKNDAIRKGGVELAAYSGGPADLPELEDPEVTTEEFLASHSECCESCVCSECCPRPRLYARSEYLYGWTKGANLPPLATTSTVGTGQNDAGVLGLASTSILFGDMKSDESGKSAGRFTLGMWLDQEAQDRLEFVYMYMGGEAEEFFRSEADHPILARPFLDVSTFTQDARLIAFGGLVEGSLLIEADNNFQSFEIHQRKRHNDMQWGTIDFLIGYRASRLNDDLTIGETTRSLSGATAGTVFELVDEFDAVSTFHGAQIGLGIQPRRRGRLDCECLLKFALGTTNYNANVQGTTTTREVGGGVTTEDSGLLALGTNSGEFEDNEFSAMSELELTLSWEMRPSLVFSFGYSVIFWSDVMRAGEQVDLGVNPTQIPPDTLMGLARPEFPNNLSSYWIQALRFGVESRF